MVDVDLLEALDRAGGRVRDGAVVLPFPGGDVTMSVEHHNALELRSVECQQPLALEHPAALPADGAR